jgi:predicted RNase H-like nuclease
VTSALSTVSRMRVIGVDGTKGGWVAVVADGGRIVAIQRVALDSHFDEFDDVGVVAIDVPIGFGPRDADGLAWERIGGSSVFAIPGAAAFEGDRYGPGRGISAQAFALGPRIHVVSALAAHDARLHEVHPEVCFWAMNGEKRVQGRKKSAGGVFERLRLLEEQGLGISLELVADVRDVPLDDVIDAAACTWSAQRIAEGRAVSLPNDPQLADGLRKAIWY